MEIQSQVRRRLPRQRVWWVLRRRCAVDRRGEGHIPGRCSKCPRVDCLDSESQSCSWPQFTTTRICEDVSATQNARTVLTVSPGATRRSRWQIQERVEQHLRHNNRLRILAERN